MQFLKKHWNGEARLWSAFWIIHFLGSIFLAIFLATFMFSFWNNLHSDFMVKAAVSLIGVIYYAYVVFASICVWRCAKNTDHEVLAVLAKLYAVLSPIISFYKMFQP